MSQDMFIINFKVVDFTKMCSKSEKRCLSLSGTLSAQIKIKTSGQFAIEPIVFNRFLMQKMLTNISMLIR